MVCILLCAISFQGASFASDTHSTQLLDTFFLDEGHSEITIDDDKVLVFLDTLGDYSQSEIKENINQGIPLSKLRNLPYLRDIPVKWFVAGVKNRSDKEINYLLNVLKDEVEVWKETHNGIITHSTGLLTPVSQKIFKTKKTYWAGHIPIDLKPSEYQTIYIRTDHFTRRTIAYPVNVLQTREKVESQINDYHVRTSFKNGTFLAFLSFVCLYFLVYYILTKENFIVFFSGYALSMLVYLLTVNDFTQYLLPEWPGGRTILIILSACLTHIFVHLFSIGFLNLKEQMPFWYKVIWSNVIGLVVFFIFSITYHLITKDFYIHERVMHIIVLYLYVQGLIFSVALLLLPTRRRVLFALGAIYANVLGLLALNYGYHGQVFDMFRTLEWQSFGFSGIMIVGLSLYAVTKSSRLKQAELQAKNAENSLRDIRVMLSPNHNGHLSNSSKYSNQKLKEDQDLLHLRKLINENISNPQFSVSHLAEMLNVSTRHLNRNTHRIAGMSPHDLIRNQRLEMAKTLLENRVLPSTEEVARKVGYSTLSYFLKLYKAKFSIDPEIYFKSGGVDQEK